jgi:hypothetical protein
LTKLPLGEASPASVKYALSLFGLTFLRLRFPLVEFSVHSEDDIYNQLRQLSDRYGVLLIGNVNDD